MALLFTPLKMGGITLANRICVPPMCRCLAHEGVGSQELIRHYERLAASGAGLVVVEATAVRDDGRITVRCLGLYTDEQEAFFRRLLQAARAAAPEGTKFFIQLSHSGRKGSRKDPKTGRGTLLPDQGGFPLMAPSALSYTSDAPLPREMTEADIEGVLRAFETAAARAKRAGFDGIQIHAAHGYLVHQFLSPVTNRRCDAWGGSPEKRRRFASAVVDAVRKGAQDLPVMVRLSACDWIEGGCGIEDAVALVQELAQRGVAAADISSGGIDPSQQLPGSVTAAHGAFAHRIKEQTGMVTFTSGGIVEPLQAEEILRSQDADAVCIGREMIKNPSWVWAAAQDLSGTALPTAGFVAGF